MGARWPRPYACLRPVSRMMLSAESMGVARQHERSSGDPTVHGYRRCFAACSRFPGEVSHLWQAFSPPGSRRSLGGSWGPRGVGPHTLEQLPSPAAGQGRCGTMSREMTAAPVLRGLRPARDACQLAALPEARSALSSTEPPGFTWEALAARTATFSGETSSYGVYLTVTLRL